MIAKPVYVIITHGLSGPVAQKPAILEPRADKGGCVSFMPLDWRIELATTEVPSTLSYWGEEGEIFLIIFLIPFGWNTI